MSSRKVILLLVAAMVAIGTVMVARSMMQPQTEAAQAPVVPATQVLAATHDLAIGSILKESDMKWIPWATDTDTSQFYVKSKDDSGRLIGAVLRDGMRSGDPFLTGHVVQPHDHGFLAAVLQPGKRAISIMLSPSSEVAGFIFPGDHVDVILTHSFSRKDNADLTERRVSETVLSDVRVLALDQKSDSMSTDPKVAQLATLEVTPKQAEKIALAADLVGQAGPNARGSLSLVLRSLAAEDAVNAAPEPGTGTGDTAAPAAGEKLPVVVYGTGGSPAAGLAPPPPGENGMAPSATPSATWDSDVSSAFPGLNGDDGLMQRVHIMRGKDSTDANFERRR
jgi:pilus assembly protein CpaB